MLVRKFKIKKLADKLFPSDDRMNDPGIFNMLKMSFFTMLDVFNKIVQRKSSNMQVILKKNSA